MKIKCDPPPTEISILNSIASTYSLPFDLSNGKICTSTQNANYFSCDVTNSFITTLSLSLSTGPAQYLPSIDGLTNLKQLTLGVFVLVNTNFWDNEIGSLEKLETVLVDELISQPIYPLGSKFFPTLKTLGVKVRFNPPPELFQTQITTLYLSISNAVTALPTLTQNVVIKTFHLNGLSTFFFLDSSVSKFINLEYLNLNRRSNDLFGFNKFNLFPSLTTLLFSGSETALPSGATSIPNSLTQCTKLASLFIAKGWFTPTTSFYDFSAIATLSYISISGTYLSACQYPCLSVDPHLSFQLSITGDTSFTNIQNLDLTNFTVVSSENGYLASTLLDNQNFYLKKEIYLSSNSLSGAIPSSLCTASSINIKNNLFTSIPSCMRCNIAKFSPYIYPNSLLPVISTSSCPTLLIQNSTKSFYTTGGVMNVVGIDLGDSAEIVISNPPTVTFDIPFKQFHFQLPSGVGRNQVVNVKLYPNIVGSQINIPLTFDYMPPKISSLSIQSGRITIKGTNFGNIPTSTSVRILDQDYQIASVTHTTVILNLPQKIELLDAIFTLHLTVGGQTDSILYKNLQNGLPKIAQPIPDLNIKGGSSYFVLNNVYDLEANLVTLTIDGKTCIITSSTHNLFDFNYTEFTSGGLKSMVVSIQDGLYTDTASINVNAPVSCVPIPHSTCVNNEIVCDEGWSGEDCSSQIIIVYPGFNNTSPSTGSESNATLPGGEIVKFSTLVSILELREYNSATNEVIKVFPFNEWALKKLNDSEFQYRALFTNTFTTSIEVNIKYYSSKQTIEFANQSITILPSTLKYQISISPYHFEKTTSSLMLVFNTQIERSQQSEESCSNINYGDDPTSDDYQFVRLQVNEVSLYGKFIKYGIVDNRTRVISNSFIPDNSTQISTKSGTLIGINIPYFTKEVILDPDFSVLVDTKSASTKTNSLCSVADVNKKLTSSQVAGIVVSVVGFVAVASIAIGYVVYRNLKIKRELNNFKNKLDQVNNIN
ncbi:EGF-like domain-containing protein [Tieghemostelium lacteum]|uniref:EGF-like domain-containing protein n=1 Tax=Tieghemostelium lacteum TaxID=361077 RepID=A0A151Z3W6_TIELA|nr:EGF-like domain-containing protein [Tieghemostelium lacteum]|eukprot:KYQ88656.1 EGF-like domain-containing protein [Tieghemostelium lacteum]